MRGMLRAPRHLIRLAAVLSCAALHAGELPATSASAYMPPLPAVVAFAAAQKIPLDQLELSNPGTTEARRGDCVTALVTLYEGEHYRQWIIQLTTVKLTAAEQRDIEKAKSRDELTMFSSVGNTLRINSVPYALEARTIGPFYGDQSATPSKSPKPAEMHARMLVSGGLLGLGLDRFCVGVQRLRQAAQPPGDAVHQLEWKTGMKPFPADVVAKNQPLAAAAGITPEDERSIFAGPMALLTFFNVAQKTPGLREILLELLNRSSLAWSILTHGGQLKPDFKPDGAALGSPVDSAAWDPNLPPAYRCPVLISLNEKPALAMELIVTAPRPPLLNCAGILGITVEPTGDKTKHLTIRVLAARRAEASTAP